MRWAPRLAIAVLGGCGRIGFGESVGDASAPIAIEAVGTFVAHGHATTTAIDTFTASAARAGDAIVLHTFCTSNVVVTGLTLDAPGWTFFPLGPFTASIANTDYVASFGTIAPDTLPHTFTVTWTGTPQCQFMDELGDELANADPAGGPTTFDAHTEMLGSAGDCTATLTTGHAGDAIWAACSGNVSAIGAGYAKGADDGNQDWSEYLLSPAPAGTVAQPTFTSTGTSWAMTAVSIAPRTP